MPSVVLEVCIASVEDAIAACAGGADRLELNMAIELGGLTPTIGLLQAIKQAVDIPVVAMVRPRAAGFRYSKLERQLIVRDTELLLEQGVAGVAVGVLADDGTIDCEFMQTICRLALGREVVFHRAFDLIADQQSAILQLIDCGVKRVLTSGGRETAMQGRDQIRQLVQAGSNRIEILPAAGVSPDNVVDLLRATGCNQVHGSFRERRQDPAGVIAAGHYPATRQALVAKMRSILDQFAQHG